MVWQSNVEPSLTSTATKPTRPHGFFIQLSLRLRIIYAIQFPLTAFVKLLKPTKNNKILSFLFFGTRYKFCLVMAIQWVHAISKHQKIKRENKINVQKSELCEYIAWSLISLQQFIFWCPHPHIYFLPQLVSCRKFLPTTTWVYIHKTALVFCPMYDIRTRLDF